MMTTRRKEGEAAETSRISIPNSTVLSRASRIHVFVKNAFSGPDMEHCLRKYEHSLKWLGVLAAAVFALYQFYIHIEEVKVQKTLEFYTKFSTDPIYSEWSELMEAWETEWNKKAAEFPTPSSKEEARLQLQAWRMSVMKFLSEKKLVIKTDAVFDFFSALQVCIENNICDKESAHDLLKPAAKRFVGNNCPYIAYVRIEQGVEGFGTKANTFAGMPCDPSIYEAELIGRN